MTKVVDCRALAASLEAIRPPDDDAAGSLADRFGIDGSRSLTELERVDLGDAEDWGDLALVNALRYLPLARLTAADVSLLMTYDASPDLVFPLARILLERDPLQEAEHYPGDLLLAAARLTVARQHGSVLRMPGPVPLGDDADAIKERIDDALARFWVVFELRAADQKLPVEAVDAARRLLVDGPRVAALGWYRDLDNLMNVLCEAKAWLDPPRILERAFSRTFFARSKGERLRIVAPGDEADAEREARHSFRRDAIFEIAQDQERVRLLVRSPSAIEDWRGTAFPSGERARDFASSHYGVGTDAWRSAGPEDAIPANHLDLR